MGNRLALLSFSGFLVTGLLLFVLQPLFANAASMSPQLIKRLCDRQAALSDRLARPLIDPAFCGVQPEPEPTLLFTANPTAIALGASSTLSWFSTNATSCTASNGWSGSKSLFGSQIVTPTATTTYGLTCTGAGGSIFKQVTVGVTPTTTPLAPTLTFTASTSTVQQAETSTLSWSSTNATSCIASLGWSGAKPTSGTQNVFPTATTTYQLDCSGPGGEVTATTTVNVIVPSAAPTVSLNAIPSSVTQGEGSATTTLTWSSTNTTSCVASGGTWTGSKAVSGSEVVTPTATTTYALNCSGPGGTGAASTTVNFVPALAPTLDFSANPTSVTPGAGTATSTLTWTSTNTTSCTASNGWSGSKSLSGSEVVQPIATTTYVLNCSGFGGNVTATTTVNFVASSSPPTLLFSANPISVTPGAGTATSTLTWSSANATFCIASNGWTGSQTLSGSSVVQPVATTTYQLDCGGSNGTTTQSVTVDFVPPQAEGKLLITEVLYDVLTPQVEFDHEWIEIHNGTNSAIDLSGYSIHDNNGFDYIPNGTTLPAGAFLFVTASSTSESLWTIPAGAVKLVLADGDLGGNGFANTGDKVLLMNVASSTIDHVSWGSNADAFSPSVFPTTSDDNQGSSIVRTPATTDTDSAADWALDATPTPGE